MFRLLKKLTESLFSDFLSKKFLVFELTDLSLKDIDELSSIIKEIKSTDFL